MKQAVVGREGEAGREAQGQGGGQVQERIEQCGQKEPPTARYRILYEMGLWLLGATLIESDGWGHSRMRPCQLLVQIT